MSLSHSMPYKSLNAQTKAVESLMKSRLKGVLERASLLALACLRFGWKHSF
jgi:hypothetical protein